MPQASPFVSTDPNAARRVTSPSAAPSRSPFVSTDPSAGRAPDVYDRRDVVFRSSTGPSHPAADLARGVGAGLASTVYHGGDLVRRLFGMERIIDHPEAQAAMTPPESVAGQIGFYGEQIAEFASPLARVSRALSGSRLGTRAVGEAAASGGVAALQSGGDPGTVGTAVVAGAVLPVAGVALRASGRAAQRAAAGAREGGIGGAVAGAIRTAAPQQPRTMLVQALKPRSTNTRFEQSLDRAMPELKITEETLGRPIASIDDLLEATRAAKQRVRAQYDELAGPMREMGSTVDLTPVAEAAARSIPRKTLLENPAKAKALIERSAVYRRRLPIEEAEEILRDTNAELDGFYAKYPTAQRKALASDPEIAALEAQATALRNVIYMTLDHPGQGAAARELNRRYGALMSVEHETYRRANVAKRQQPESLNEQISNARAAGDFARGAWRLAHKDLTGFADIASAHAMRSAAKFMKEQQTTDALIRRAFASFDGRPAPVEMPRRPAVRGLLTRGPRFTPPPADDSYVRGVPAEPARRDVRGLLPPARQTRVTPPPADGSRVQSTRAGEYLRWDPQQRRWVKVYLGVGRESGR